MPLINAQGACATASMGFHLAWRDILTGQSQVTLAMGVEKIFFPDDKAKAFAIF